MSTVISICLYFQTLAIINSHAIVVNTNYGKVEGEVNSYGLNTFHGIPFAKPPIDDLRWSSPQEPDSWSDTLNAKQQDVPACIQGCAPDYCAVESEDCLYLNIYAPANAKKGSDFQTLVFIYGGSFDKGSTDFPVYDPSNFINNVDDDIIIVIPNYRVGILGFLYDNTFDTGVIGNYGVEDQAMAIEWVYQNIRNFGGDEDNIVIYGQSAGAQSVALHLLYDNANIKAGIMQSPTFFLPLRDPVTWYDVPVEFTNLIGCNSSLNSTELFNCWLSTDAETILQVQDDNSDYPGAFSKGWPYGMPWSPTAGTSLIPRQPINEWKRGEIETPPFMVGTNKDEFYHFIDDRLIPFFGYPELFGTLFAMTGSALISAQVLAFYGITPNQTYTDYYLHDLGQIFTDNWQCSVRNVLGNLGKKPKNIYFYNFDVVNADLFENVLWSESSSKHACWTRNCHFTDIPYLFTPPMYTANNLFDNNTMTIGKQLQTWWTNYATTLNPNKKCKKSDSGVSTSVKWPKYINKNKKNMLQILDAHDYDALSSHQYDPYFCDFWDQIGYAGNYSLADMSTVDNAETNGKNAQGIDWKTENGRDEENNVFHRMPLVGIIIGCSLLCIMSIVGLVIIVMAKTKKLKRITQISTNDDSESEDDAIIAMCVDTATC